ncbi:MAG: Gfo/Idh/MocA family oxidoreductase, partial [Candidatus Poribacteria bacterium]
FEDVVAIAREKNLLVQLGYMFRYNEAFQRIFALADAGALGEVFSVRGRMSTSVGLDTREKLSRHKGGIMFELLPHLVDAVVTLLGRPEKVTSFLRNDEGPVPEFDDNTLAVFEYANAMATLSSAAIENEPFPCRRFEVYGSKGSAIIEPLEPPSLRVCLSEAGYAYDTGAGYDGHAYEHGWQTVEVEKRSRYLDDVVAFVADIRGEKQPDRSLDHELLVQETILRASQRGVS